MRDRRPHAGPVPIAEVLAKLDTAQRTGVDVLRRGALKTALREALGPTLAARCSLVRLTDDEIVLGAGGASLVALRGATARIRAALAVVGYQGELHLVAIPGEPRPWSQLG